MYGTYLRLDIIVYDAWRTVVRAAARKLTALARRDPARRKARHRFYREMLAHHKRRNASFEPGVSDADHLSIVHPSPGQSL